MGGLLNLSHQVVLGLGSNCGDRLTYLRQAILFISSTLKILSISPLYESDALLPEGAPQAWDQPFFNLCILCETTLSPHELLQKVKAIETRVGRQARGRWAPREVDIDLLSYGDLYLKEETLALPHPRLFERPFALLPLADLTPEWIDPTPSHGKKIPVAEQVAPWRYLPPEQVPFQTQRSLSFLPELVGILNITPDSFSDGGRFNKPETALRQAQLLVNHGARILDIGAESTRPQASPITPREEWERLEPILNALLTLQSPDQTPLRMSLDTRHFETASKALKKGGISWINDVSGLSDPKLQKLLAQSDVDVVFMHSLSVPPRPGEFLAGHEDPLSQLLRWGNQRIEELVNAGISRERLIFDPGLGFGKTVAQSWEILRGMNRLHDLGVRLFVGHSRKSFLSRVTASPSAQRDLETITASLSLARAGVHYLRVHDVESHQRCLKVWALTEGKSRCTIEIA